MSLYFTASSVSRLRKPRPDLAKPVERLQALAESNGFTLGKFKPWGPRDHQAGPLPAAPVAIAPVYFGRRIVDHVYQVQA